MKNKLLMIGLLALLVGCGGNSNSSSSKVASTPSVTPSISSPSVSSNTSSPSISSPSSSSSKVSITPSNPTINVLDGLRININEKVNYLTLVNAYDTIDGNISHLIEVELPSGVTLENGDLSFEKEGNYEIKFKVTNSSNLSSSALINIEVYAIDGEDKNAPVIIGQKDIRVKPNVTIYPLDGVTASDDFDGNVTSSLVATYLTEGDATDGISFEEEGNYEITISVSDNAGNKVSKTINIEVNSEDLPTFVNMTVNLILEYNCNINNSDVVPYEGAISKEVVLKVKTSQVYANFKLPFDDPIDLENKQISMYVKVGENVKSNRLTLDLRQGTEGVGQKQFEIKESQGNGYIIEDKGNGWFLFTVVFNKVWNISTYVTDYIRLVFANEDVTKTANIYIADLLIDDYKDDGSSDNPSIPDTPEVSEDLTDSMEVNYNCVIELDKEVSHDGVQSAKIKAFDEWISTKNYVNKDLAGHIITFYVKFSGTSMYKNRVYVQFKDTSDAAIINDIAISTQDSLPEGVTLSEPDENGWSKVTVDCSLVGAGGVETRKLNIKFRCADAVAKDGVAWLDELYITKKGAE